MKLTDDIHVTSYPECDGDNNLCEMFGDFFIDKIDSKLKNNTRGKHGKYCELPQLENIESVVNCHS